MARNNNWLREILDKKEIIVNREKFIVRKVTFREVDSESFAQFDKHNINENERTEKKITDKLLFSEEETNLMNIDINDVSVGRSKKGQRERYDRKKKSAVDNVSNDLICSGNKEHSLSYLRFKRQDQELGK